MAPAGVTLLADLDDVVFSIVASRVDAEEEAAEEALEYGDDEDLSEPEVIARGKDEDDE